MDLRTSPHALGRAYRWADARGYVWDAKLRGRLGSVFEVYTWRSVGAVLVAFAGVSAVLFPLADFSGRMVIGAFMVTCSLWYVTFAALGRGEPERSMRELLGAAGVAVAVIFVCTLAAHATLANVLGWEAPQNFYALIVISTLICLGQTLYVSHQYATDQRRLALVAASQEGARAEREAGARGLAEARLAMLHAQIEPHFIFNALAHLHTLIGEDPAAAQAMTGALTRYLRQAIPDKRRPGSTLGRELDLARAYLEVMRIRMGERLGYSVDADAGVVDVPFPPLILATLVENAIKHGLERKPGGGHVEVRARRLEQRLVVTVHDDGLGFAPRDESGSGLGLANTRDRLNALYGDAAELVVEPNVPAGCAVTIAIPWKDAACPPP